MNQRTDKPQLGAVLPLSIRGSYDVDDLGRTDILFASLTAFIEPGTLGPILVVTPPDEVARVTEVLARWSQFDIRVMSEETLLPELAGYRQVRGWRKQQLVKIGAARALETPFILTLDADVICLKPLSIRDLIIDGRALLQYEARAIHPKWWRSSARLLNMSPDIGDPEIGMSVTPTILSRDLCLLLADELTPKRNGTWVDRLCRLHRPSHPSNWTLGRLLRSKWTEYSLYYLNALKHGRLDDFHIRAGTTETPQTLLSHAAHPFESWDTADSFTGTDPALFCIVGSKSFLSPEVVWQRVKPFINPGGQSGNDDRPETMTGN